MIKIQDWDNYLTVDPVAIDNAIAKIKALKVLHSTMIEAPPGMTKEEMKQFIGDKAEDE